MNQRGFGSYGGLGQLGGAWMPASSQLQVGAGMYAGPFGSAASDWAKAHAGMPKRTVQGKGGWTYRQWSNGDIWIAGAPKGVSVASLPNGGFYSAADRSKQWAAITAEIGAASTGASAARYSAVKALATSAAALAPSALAMIPRAGGGSSAYPPLDEGAPSGGGFVDVLKANAPVFVGLSVAGGLVIVALLLFSASSRRSAQAAT